MAARVGRTLLSAAFDFRFCLERLIGPTFVHPGNCQAKSTSKAADEPALTDVKRSVRPTPARIFYSGFRKRAESGGRVKLREKGRPWVG